MGRAVWHRCLGLVLGLSLLGSVPVRAGYILYGGNGNTSNPNPGGIITINQSTGAGSFLGTPIASGGLSGLAVNAAEAMYGSISGGPGSTSKLVHIDPVTGTSLGIIGSITANGSPISIGDLAFQPGTGVLYGIRSKADKAGKEGYLYTIDVATGQATFVGDTGRSQGAIGFGPDGTLYELSPVSLTLNTLNPTTGAVLSSIPVPFAFDGLGVRPNDGVLFASRETDLIYTVDPITGAATLVGSTGAGSPSDLDFVPTPVPPSLILLTTGMAGLAVTAWRRRGRLLLMTEA